MADALQRTIAAAPRGPRASRIAIAAGTVLIAALLLGRQHWIATRDATPGRGDLGTMQRICEDCGDDASFISADGRALIAFDGDHLVVRSLKSGTTRRIRAVPEGMAGFGVWPALSSDGRRVAFAWLAERAEIRTLDLDRADGASRILATEEFEFWPIGWLPNGAAILAKSIRPDQTTALEWISTATGERRIFKELGWRSTGFDRPAIAPDGRFVVYSAMPVNPGKPPLRATRGAPRQPPPTEQHLFVRAVDDSSDVPLVAAAGLSRSPFWSLDGSRLLYFNQQGDSRQLMSLPMRAGRAGGPVTIVNNAIGNISPIALTASGRYYFAKRVVTPARGAVYSITPPSAGAQLAEYDGSRATWSPDGRRIALIRRPTDDRDNASVEVTTLDTGTKVTYAHPSPLATNPALWFADRPALLLELAAANGQVWARWDLNAPGESPKILTRNRGDSRYVTNRGVRALSPDGQILYLAAYGTGDEARLLTRVVALDLMSGQYRDVFRLPGPAAELPSAAREMAIAISPDGRTLGMQTIIADNLTRLAVVNVDGSHYRELCALRPAPPAVRERLVWMRQKNTLLFTEGGGSPRFRIMRVSSDGGVPEFTGVALDSFEVLDASPDGTRILASRGEANRFEIWSLMLNR